MVRRQTRAQKRNRRQQNKTRRNNRRQNKTLRRKRQSRRKLRGGFDNFVDLEMPPNVTPDETDAAIKLRLFLQKNGYLDTKENIGKTIEGLYRNKVIPLAVEITGKHPSFELEEVPSDRVKQYVAYILNFTEHRTSRPKREMNNREEDGATLTRRKRNN